MCGGSIAKYQASVRIRKAGEDDWDWIQTDEASWDVISPELWARGEKKVAGEGLVLVTHLTALKLLQFFSNFSDDRKLHVALGDKFTVHKEIEAIEIVRQGNTMDIPFSIDGELHTFSAVQLRLVKNAAILFGPPLYPTSREEETSSTAATSNNRS
jgi:hypothetical protein